MDEMICFNRTWFTWIAILAILISAASGYKMGWDARRKRDDNHVNN